MNKCYYRIVWENYPSDKTPLNEQNLNKIDVATDEVDNRIISLDTAKFDKSEAQLLIKNITFDLQTGILTKYYYNGSTEEINTGISKLNMNLRFDKESQILYIVNADGTEDPIDLSVFITNYEFQDSDTIAHNVSSTGVVSSVVKEGSIQEKHLRPDYLADIKVEVAKAEASKNAAATSEVNAKKSADAAKESQTATKASETNAAESAVNAEASATTATQKAAEAASSAAAAKASEDNSKDSEAKAKASETAAESHKTEAASSASSAAGSAATATTKAGEASGYADMSKSYAVGTGGEVRENDDTDCAEYFYEQTKRISQSISGVVPMGTISFDGLDNPDNQKSGYLFNISDSFISDDRFADGGGIFYGAGNNVLYTADGKWDVLAASMVSGVKGSAETEYRQGFVNITKANIGLGSVGNFKAVSTKANQGLSSAEKTNARNNISALAIDGDSKDNTVSFASGDNANPTGWTDVDVATSGEKHSSLWNKATTFFKNVRYLKNLIGNTQLSVGDGTVIGAINQINSNFESVFIINQLVYDPSNVIINYAEKIGRILLLTGTVLDNIDISIKLPPGMHIRTIFGIPCQNYSAWGNGDFQCFLAPINVSGNEIIVHTAGSPYTYTIFYVVAFITSV